MNFCDSAWSSEADASLKLCTSEFIHSLCKPQEGANRERGRDLGKCRNSRHFAIECSAVGSFGVVRFDLVGISLVMHFVSSG